MEYIARIVHRLRISLRNWRGMYQRQRINGGRQSRTRGFQLEMKLCGIVSEKKKSRIVGCQMQRLFVVRVLKLFMPLETGAARVFLLAPMSGIFFFFWIRSSIKTSERFYTFIFYTNEKLGNTLSKI